MFSSPTNSEPAKNPRNLPRHFDCEDFAMQWEEVIESVAEQAPIGSEGRTQEVQKPKNQGREGRKASHRWSVTSDRIWERQLLWVLWVFTGSLMVVAITKSYGLELVAEGYGPMMIAICSMQMALMGRILGRLGGWHLPMMGIAWVAMKLNAEALTCLGCLQMAQAEQYLILLLGIVSVVARLGRATTVVESFALVDSRSVEQVRTGSRYQFSIGEILSVTMYLAIWIPLREATEGFSLTSFFHHPMLPFLAGLCIQLLLVGGWLMELRCSWAASVRLACLPIPMIGLAMCPVSQLDMQATLIQATWVALGGLAYYAMQWAVTEEPSRRRTGETVSGSFAN